MFLIGMQFFGYETEFRDVNRLDFGFLYPIPLIARIVSFPKFEVSESFEIQIRVALL